MTSTYPNEKFDRFGIPRIPATQTAVKHNYSRVQQGLGTSLACYVSEDDVALNRKEFLRQVRDRIDLDLLSGDY